MCSSDIFLGIICIFFPPLGVWVKTGICSADSIINIALCFLGYLPGLFHAWYIIATTPDFDFEVVAESDAEAARGNTVTYYYVQGPGAPPRSYGTVNQQPQPQPQQPQPASSSAQAQDSTQAPNGEIPPPYSEAIKGDHKVQNA